MKPPHHHTPLPNILLNLLIIVSLLPWGAALPAIASALPRTTGDTGLYPARVPALQPHPL